MKKVETEVLLFGVLAEVAGRPKIVIQNSGDIESLLEQLYIDYPLFIEYNFQVSVNHGIVKGNSPVVKGDEVALLPPFAGG